MFVKMLDLKILTYKMTEKITKKYENHGQMNIEQNKLKQDFFRHLLESLNVEKI